MKLRSILESDGVDEFYRVLDALESEFASKKYYFHGSPDISFSKSAADLKPVKNTVDSKYTYLSPYLKTSLGYCADNNLNWKGTSPGIGVFKVKGSAKVYKFTKDDITSSNNWKSFNERLDNLKEAGYDIVSGTQQKQEIIALNPNALTLIKVIHVKDL